jgi:hypothetical protein
MDVGFCVGALTEAIELYGCPEIFNTDQGSQGGFNWSSQHLDLGGVWRGDGGLEQEDQRCSRGLASAVAC